MYSSLQLALKYFSYYLTASNGRGHGIHSPFVFDFVTNVLNDRRVREDFGKIEAVRKKLLKDRTILAIDDYGAGSSVSGSNRRSVAAIARHALKPAKYAQLLYRMVSYYQPKTIVELGTSLGITASYLSLAQPGAQLYSFEGAAEIMQKANETFLNLHLSNVKVVEGNFDYTLPTVLYYLPAVDLAFIDGNHRRAPTETYFQWLLPKTNNESILIFDDIHWSNEMEQAWAWIKQHAAVTCTMDLFFMGVVLFRRQFKEKQHFTIRF